MNSKPKHDFQKEKTNILHIPVPEQNIETAKNYTMRIKVKQDLYIKGVKEKQAARDRDMSYFCNICSKDFSTLTQKNNHLTIMHRPLTVNIKYGAYCNTCHGILEENIFNNHVPCSKSEYLETPRFKRKVDCILNEQQTEYLIAFGCCVCYKKFGSKKELLTHSRIIHRPITTNFENNTGCAFCETCEMFHKEDVFANHFPCNAVDIRCFFCLTTMPSKSHFLYHNLTYHSWRKFQCNFCETDTKEMTFSELNEHMKIHQPNCGVYKCMKCNLFLGKLTLAKHTEHYHKGCRCLNITCHCDKFNEAFYLTKILKTDIALNEDKTYFDVNKPTNITYPTPECDFADEDWSVKFCEDQILPDIASRKLEDQILPDIASRKQLKNKNFETLLPEVESEDEIDIKISDFENEAEVHYKNYQQLVSTLKSEDLNEQDTSELFSDSEGIEENIEGSAHSNTRLTSEQEETNPNGTNIEKQRKCIGKRKSNSTEYVCVVCGSEFKNELELYNHCILYHRPWAAEVLKDYYCELCNTCFDEYQYHLPCHKQASMRRCHICTMQHPFKEHFLLHKINFIAYRRMNCLLCKKNSKTFTLYELNEHRKTAHKQNGVFECLKCEVNFGKMIDLKRHLIGPCLHKDKESILETFKLKLNDKSLPEHMKCKICNKIFFSKVFLEHHMKTHEISLCFICGQTFTKRDYYQEHINQHLKTVSYDCKFCDKKFYMRKYWVQHKKIHEDNKKFVCTFCPKSFVQQVSLIYHMAVHTKENAFVCSVCGKKWDTQRKLSSHMKIHTADGTNPHKCLVCDKYFTHKCNLLVHMRMHDEAK